jgi:Holliday junction resolvasome RuvABC endonuclease subunit
MSILALDIGNEFGYAIKQSATIDSGWDILSKKGSTDHGRKFYNFACWLNDVVDVDVVYYEKVMRHVSVHSAHAYGGFLAILQVWAHKRNIPCIGVGVGVIKKSFTGKGNAKKQMMIAEANKRGFETGNDNEADAIALLHYALELDK